MQKDDIFSKKIVFLGLFKQFLVYLYKKYFL